MPTLNGHNLLRADIYERTLGNWVAQVEADSEDDIGPEVTIDIDGVTWVGTVWRGGLETGRYKGTIVGGAGGLEADVGALWYSAGVTLRTPISDVLAIAGETLSPEADPDVTGKVVPAWHRSQGKAKGALSALRDRGPAGTTWRILRDGTVWFGVDTFPELEQDSEDVITDPMPGDGRLEVGPETPYIYPGVTYAGERVSEVVTILRGPSLRQELVTRAPGDASLTPEQQMDARIERALVYLRQYPSRVLGQSGGKVDVLPDDLRIRGNGITGVPIRLGLPGVTVTLALGSKVLLGFEGGDPSMPYASTWPDGSGVTSVTFAGDLTVAGTITGTEVVAGGLALTTHVHPIPTPTGPTGPGQAPPPPP